MEPGDAVDDREPEPSPCGAASRRLPAGKGPLQAFDFFGGNPRSAIGDFEHHRSVRVSGRDLDGRRTVPQRVVDEVEDGLACPDRVQAAALLKKTY